MGDHREQLVDLDTPASDAGARAEQVRAWLIASGWAAPGGVEDWLYPGEVSLTAGPEATRRHPALDDSTIVVPVKDFWIAGDGTAGPICPACGTEEQSLEQVGEWVTSGIEPIGTCASCGFTAPLGDWDLTSSIARGELGIVLDPRAASDQRGRLDPVALARDLQREVVAALGGRWTYIHHHV